jgi:hypothetical protein
MNLGPDRLIADLQNLGFEVNKVAIGPGVFFAVIPAYEIVAGKFIGRIIDLGIQCTANFPMSVHAAIHIKANPQLYEPAQNIPTVRNVTASALGPEWRYWSKNFCWNGEKSARRLVSQINSIFENA